MKELFQMLNDPRFHLLYGVTQRFSTGPEPQLVRLNREGFKLVEGVTKKTLVHPRMRLAVHPSPLKGDAFSPIFGRISEINERSIFVEAVEPNEEQRLAAEAVEKDKVDLLALPERGAELGKILKGLGLNTRSLGQDCKTLIINGLNPDPGVTWAEPMLLTHLDNLKAGLEVLRRLSPAEKILLAVPKEMRLHYHDIEVAHVPSQYPASVNALVVKAVTGKPIKFIGTGEKLDQIEPFHPGRMASRILGMGDVLTLIEKAEAAFDQKKAAELEQKLRSNKFTLTDFYDQLTQLKGMGSLDEIAGMIPGMNAGALKGAQVDEKAMARTEAIIQSMTPYERENPSVLNHSRKRRIAAGSGVKVEDINRLLKQFDMMNQLAKQFSGPGAQKKMKRMGKKGGFGGFPGFPGM